MKNTIITDERKGCTSASAAEADALCQGRHRAQIGLPETTSDDAASGNRIHAHLAGEQVALSDDELDLAEKCWQVEKELVQKIFGDNLDNAKIYREQRLWSDFGGFKHSGKPDLVYVVGKVGAVLDYKTGRNEVAESPRNLQLRDLAVLAAIEYQLDEVHVAIIQPWATMKPEVCCYTKRDLILALGEMEARIVASNAPNAPRTPGEVQCKYCKAKAVCPEARQVAITPPANAVGLIPPIDPVKIDLELSCEDLGAFLDKATIAESIIDACREEAKRRLTEGEAIPGYTLKAGATRESITDAQECFNRCAAKGVTLDAFMGAVTIAKGKLKDAVKSATGDKGKALDATLAQILDGITEEKQAAPSLVKI